MNGSSQSEQLKTKGRSSSQLSTNYLSSTTLFIPAFTYSANEVANVLSNIADRYKSRAKVCGRHSIKATQSMATAKQHHS